MPPFSHVYPFQSSFPSLSAHPRKGSGFYQVNNRPERPFSRRCMPPKSLRCVAPPLVEKRKVAIALVFPESGGHGPVLVALVWVLYFALVPTVVRIVLGDAGEKA